MELQHAEAQRQHWRSLIAQEVLKDPLLLSLVRLCDRGRDGVVSTTPPSEPDGRISRIRLSS